MRSSKAAAGAAGESAGDDSQIPARADGNCSSRLSRSHVSRMPSGSFSTSVRSVPASDQSVAVVRQEGGEAIADLGDDEAL